MQSNGGLEGPHPVEVCGDLSFVRMQHAEDVLEVGDLYMGAFPEDERRSLLSMGKILMREDTSFWKIYREGEFVGFINTWELPSAIYGEHLAVRPSLRGHKIGTHVIEWLLGRSSQPFIFEVEPPTTEIARRRIAFYERNGLGVVTREYLQPPYSRAQHSLPMYLMGSHTDLGHQWVGQAVREMHSIVYGVGDER